MRQEELNLSQIYPIPCQLSHEGQFGSLNIFFKSHQQPNYIYGVTCAHIFKTYSKKSPVKLRQRGSLHKIIIGTINKIYDLNSNVDLAVIKFSNHEISNLFTLNKVSAAPELKKNEFEVVGLRHYPISTKILNHCTSIEHEQYFFKNLHCLKGIGGHGDSGTTIFIKEDDNIYCLGQLSFIKRENTYITNFNNNYKFLKQDYNISFFYYLT